ncbi:hypothetical protein FOA43_000680 [Brettanomyces nanus]|uniref:Uncharacterized protein n=1 Tax=Eeniella nana TaxID=13502 RepID=A0A875RN92_EENNA|nr:uncharacterized protein FOA43_000680 [Brettanomyces nanus]QPG73370.1 hypothetical protein FOA43_000680 [Brettanomyces nanus]
MLSCFDEIFDEIKQNWKAAHGATTLDYNLGVMNEKFLDEESVVTMINQILCPNYYAIQERLVFFQNHLNGLIFCNFVPMNMVHFFFFSYFVLDGSADTEMASFIRPKKSYKYSDVALIASITYLVLIFSRYNSKDEEGLQYQLRIDADQLRLLILRLLNISQFRKKATHQALLSLIVLRCSLFVYNNLEGVHESFNSYPLFQLCLVLCYQMGLHADHSGVDVMVYKDTSAMKTRTMSLSETRELWNYMQTEDAVYSISLGTPLLINYEFCAEFSSTPSDLFFQKRRRDIVSLMREVAITTNYRKDCSINDVLTLLDKVTFFCYQTSTTMFTTSQNSDLDELAYFCKIKLLLLQNIQNLCHMVILGVNELHRTHNNEVRKPENLQLLRNLSKEMYRQSLISAVVGVYLVKLICEGKTVFGEGTNTKYLVFFRDALSASMMRSFIVWFTFLLPKAVKSSDMLNELQKETMLRDYPPKENGYKKEIDVYVLERALYHKYTHEDEKLGEQLVTKLISPSELLKFASFHNKVSQNAIIKSSIDSFLAFKTVIVWIYILQTVKDCRSELENGHATMQEIVIKTKEQMRNNGGMGKIEDDVLITEDEQLKKMFDSIMADQGYSNITGSIFDLPVN